MKRGQVEPTVSEVLRAAGYTHRPSPRYGGKHDVFNAQGELVFTGDGAQAARWLRQQNQEKNHGK